MVLVAFTAPLATVVSIARDTGAGPAQQAWLLSSISIGLGVGLLPLGALADDRGRRWVFVAGSAVLAPASAACALATTPLVFVLGRIAQGLGGAAIIACSLGLIGHAYPDPARRATATGVWGASVGAGIAAGPLVAGGLDQGPGWRLSQWVLAACALALVVAGRGWLTESRADDPRRPDLVGMVLLGAGLGCVLAGLVEGREGWARPLPVLLLAAGTALTAAFVVVERRGREPMLDLALFRSPDFVAVTVTALATGLGVIALLSFITVVIERGLGGTSFDAALVLLGWSATSVLTALAARRLPARLALRHQLAGGLLVVAAGQLALYGLDAGSPIVRVLPGLVLAGVASGVINAGLGRGAVSSVPPGRGSMGSGANNTARYVGAAVGTTIVAVIASHPDPADLLRGWNHAVLVTAAFTTLGAVVILARRPDLGG